MLVLLHVLIALSSMAYSGYTFFKPAKNRLRIAFALVALTLASGTYLVISTHSPMLSACMMGLIYLGATMTALVSAHSRLAHRGE